MLNLSGASLGHIQALQDANSSCTHGNSPLVDVPSNSVRGFPDHPSTPVINFTSSGRSKSDDFGGIAEREAKIQKTQKGTKPREHPHRNTTALAT
jgi:hypothetical protein